MKKVMLVAVAVSALAAQAAEEGAYLGLNYNHVKLSADGSSGSDDAVGVYGGYRVGDIAGEISRLQKTNDGAKIVLTDFAAIPRMNVAKDVDVLGKVGVRHTEISAEGGKASGTSLVIGAGVEYAVMPQLSVRAMVDYSNKTFGESIKATTTTIGVAYKF
jgi:opacity protein-like surface antigen